MTGEGRRLLEELTDEVISMAIDEKPYDSILNTLRLALMKAWEDGCDVGDSWDRCENPYK